MSNLYESVCSHWFAAVYWFGSFCIHLQTEFSPVLIKGEIILRTTKIDM